MRRVSLAIGALLAAAGMAGCGDDNGSAGGSTTTRTVNQTTRVEVLKQAGQPGAFDPSAVYRQAAPGVVTVISVFSSSGLGSLLGNDDSPQGGLGSGFVVSSAGEVATNAHVVTEGQGRSLKRARQVYVQFADSNQLPARIVGIDPNSDIALLRINPGAITLHPLALGRSNRLTVGAPVAAIGSPFGEPQSLSVGVISAVDRSIRSLTGFRIEGAIQTDAAVNHGNSGGPLVDAAGRVLGINSQIESTGGGGEGVGFAVPADTVRRAVAELRRDGKVSYAYLGVETRSLFPQLAEKLGLPVHRGAFVQNVSKDSPAAKAGIKGGGRQVRFQVADYKVGGDVITQVAGHRIRTSSDLGVSLLPFEPGQSVRMTIWRDGKARSVTVKLGARPESP